MAEAGRVKPVIDRVFRLEETASALAHIEAGHVHGKVVVAM
jgi:NADPH:quinone reductase-like Zn-dependent oxidoreductase